MVFYFSGTGNSYQAAMAVRSENEELVEISACVNSGSYSFEISGSESVTFVMPVYYGGLPSVVSEFVKNLCLSPAPAYCCAVFTCGVTPLGAASMLSSLLAGRGLRLDAAFAVKMPINYVLLFRIPEEAKRERILGDAEKSLAAIKNSILSRRTAGIPSSFPARAASRLMYPLYSKGRKTAKFHTDDQCIGCGVCVGRCPAKAMVMEDGHPKWISERCIHCMSCIRCGAVQYGSMTKGKKRYTNPVLKSCH